MSSDTRPHILLSNDDGFRAPGIQELAHRLRGIGRVTIVAPDGPRSGYSSSISLTLPLRPKLRHSEEGLNIYSVEATPADCVKLALGVMLSDDPPTIVVSGINHGSNDGISVHYSGTIGAAREAAIVGIPTLATSLDDTAERPNFSDALAYTERVVRMMLKASHRMPSFLSLNVPKTSPLGLKVCPQAVSRFVDEWLPATNARGQAIYWMTGKQATPETSLFATDVEYLREGWATLTPLSLDLTEHAALGVLSDIFAGI